MQIAPEILRHCSSVAVLALALICGPAWAEVYVDVGLSGLRIEPDSATTGESGDSAIAAHLAVGARRPISERFDVGMGIEGDFSGDGSFAAARLVDLRWRSSERYAFGGFLGIARLDRDHPAYGYYGGLSATLREVRPGWDLSIAVRTGNEVARDNRSDEQSPDGSPDRFYDVYALTVSLRRRF